MRATDRNGRKLHGHSVFSTKLNILRSETDPQHYARCKGFLIFAFNLRDEQQTVVWAFSVFDCRDRIINRFFWIVRFGKPNVVFWKTAFINQQTQQLFRNKANPFHARKQTLLMREEIILEVCVCTHIDFRPSSNSVQSRLSANQISAVIRGNQRLGRNFMAARVQHFGTASSVITATYDQGNGSDHVPQPDSLRGGVQCETRAAASRPNVARPCHCTSWGYFTSCTWYPRKCCMEYRRCSSKPSI
jgi:hypothetical protein